MISLIGGPSTPPTRGGGVGYLIGGVGSLLGGGVGSLGKTGVLTLGGGVGSLIGEGGLGIHGSVCMSIEAQSTFYST